MAGSGAADGTSLANAYSHANARIAVIALGALTQDLEWKLAGGPAQIGATFEITKDATSTYAITMQGRNAADTADALVDVDANAGGYHAILLTSADFWRFKNIGAINAAGGFAGWKVTASADHCTWIECEARDNNGGGWEATVGALFTACINCYAARNSGFRGGFYSLYRLDGCVGDGNTGDGNFYLVFEHARNCISIDGVRGFHQAPNLADCTVYNSSNDGITGKGDSNGLWNRCIVVDAGAAGYEAHVDGTQTMLDCAHHNCTSGRLNNSVAIDDINPITLGSSPFIDAAGGDFRLNDRATGGHLVRQLGWTVPGLGQIAYPDGGAIAARARSRGAFAEMW